MKKLKKQNAITLVALIITIIILLILAGISVSALTNQGLFTQAQNAKNLTEEKTAEENVILTNYLEQMNAIIGGQVLEAPTSPSLSVSSGTSGNNGWYTSNVVVNITPGTDNGGGIDRTTYTITGAQTASETTGTSVTITAEGISTITAYTYDKAGNKSSGETITIKKDSVAPTFSGLNALTVTTWDSSTFTNNVSVSDETSGISSSTAFEYNPTSLVSGNNTITYTATDNAGNTATETRVITYSIPICFVAGTLVSTPNGFRNIEDLKAEDIVFSYNEETQQIEAKEIIKTFINENNVIATLTFENGEKIENTIAHPYYVVGKGWTETKDLEIGDEILTQEQTKIKIKNIEVNEVKTTKVYNFSVKDNHNYFVGINKMLVHNAVSGGAACGLEDMPIN